MRVGLRLGGCIGWHRRAQIAEAGHGDDANTLACQRRGEGHALIKTAAAAVHRQQRNPRSGFLIFDRAAGRRDDQAAMRHASARLDDIGLKTPSDEQGETNNHQRYEHQRPTQSSQRRFCHDRCLGVAGAMTGLSRSSLRVTR